MVHNQGELAPSDVNISFELKTRTRAFENWTALGQDKVLAVIAANSTANVTFNWTAGPPGNYTLRVSADPLDLKLEENETNNYAERSLDIGPPLGELLYYEITPSSWTMNEGDTKQFTAKGYNFYNNEIPLAVTWSVNGGGTIDATGTFEAELWGIWEIYANYSGIIEIVEVTINPKPIELSNLIVTPQKWIMVIDDTYKFSAHAFDLNDTEVQLNLEWTETGGGIIDRNGVFTAQAAGKWVVSAKYQATNGVFIDSVNVRVLTSENETVTESFGDPHSDIGLTANVGGSGTINVSKIDKPQLAIPEKLNDIGIFIEIIKSETLELEWALIKIPFESLDLPDDADPTTIKIYYWTGSEWFEVVDSWVEGDTVYANVTHFTIFAPMAESAQKDAGPEEDNTLMYVVVAIIIIIIVLLVIGILIKKRRPTEKEALEAEVDEEFEFDLTKLDRKTKRCRKCGEPIEVPVSEDEKISIKCGECGARGRIPNPYLSQIVELKAEALAKSHEEELEDMDDWDAADEEEAEDELEWADDEDEIEEPDTEVEPEEESEDWDRSDEEIEKDELEAVEEFEEPTEEDEEELADWDETEKDQAPEDELDDWD
jgi:hypothetical protein